MIILALATIIYGVVAGVPHETLFLGIAIMIAGLSIEAGCIK